MKDNERDYLSWRSARKHIEHCDTLLFQGAGIIGSLLCKGGRGEHSHAAKAAWWDGDLFCMEIKELHGGRAVTLASQVRRYPRTIDVYGINPIYTHFNRSRSIALMRDLMGCRYGYRSLLKAGLVHYAGTRLFAKADFKDQQPLTSSPFCSWAVSWADRVGGGEDPVPHLADWHVMPSDLEHSKLYEYRFTIRGETKAEILNA